MSDRAALLARRKALLAERAEVKAKMKDPVGEAREVSDLIFKKRFRAGGDWLERVKRLGRRDNMVVGLLGGVRHMFGYMHNEESIQAALDRRGANSIIQGPSSNLGFVGSYFARKLVWDLYGKHGVDLGYIQCNSVHDASESEAPPVNVPLVNYLCDHAYSTCIHLFVRDVLNFETNTSFEMDSAVGPTMSEMFEATRWDDQVEAIRKSMEWQRDNLGAREPIDETMEIVEHNAKIIWKIRSREIERQLRLEERVSYRMLINEENSLRLGLKFESPAPKSKTRDSWKKEIEQ